MKEASLTHSPIVQLWAHTLPALNPTIEADRMRTCLRVPQQHELIEQAVSFCVEHFAASTRAQDWVNVIDKADNWPFHVRAMWSKPGKVREPGLSTTKLETSQSTCHWSLPAHP